MSNLKPCPFCGSKPRITIGLESGLAVAECATENCPAEYTENEFDIWNARASSWISVDDAKPENDNQYIAWVGERALVLFYCDDGYWCEHYGSQDYSSNVTHWMQLPDAPKL